MVKNENIDLKTKLELINNYINSYLRKNHFLGLSLYHTSEKFYGEHACYNFKLFNSVKNRKINLSFCPIENFNDFFNVFFSNESDSGSFSLKEYIKFKKHKNIEKELGFLDRKSDELFERFLSRFFDQLFEYLNSDLKDIVIGEKWISIPVDWHGYK